MLPTKRDSWVVQSVVHINSTWPTAAILEVCKQVYLSHFCTDFHQILCADLHLKYECHLYEKLHFSEIQDGGVAILDFEFWPHLGH